MYFIMAVLREGGRTVGSGRVVKILDSSVINPAPRKQGEEFPHELAQWGNFFALFPRRPRRVAPPDADNEGREASRVRGGRKLGNTAGTLVHLRPSLYENEGEDAGAASPSHMRNYLATIDRLPAKRSAAGRWTSLQPQSLRDQGLRFFRLTRS